MIETTQILSEQEFLTFLLIYGSYADLEFSDDEKQRIKEKVGDSSFRKMDELFDSLTEYQVLHMLKYHEPYYFSTQEKKAKILSTLNDQFSIDGEYSKLEKTLLNFLDHFL